MVLPDELAPNRSNENALTVAVLSVPAPPCPIPGRDRTCPGGVTTVPATTSTAQQALANVFAGSLIATIGALCPVVKREIG